MNEIEDRWEKLKLTEEEAQNIDFDDDESEELKYKQGLSLVGKISMEG